MSPYIWLALVVLFIFIETSTVTLVTIWFAIGALAASIASFYRASLTIQLWLFFGLSLVILLIFRPIATGILNKSLTPTNINSVVGKTALVTEEINNLAQTGQVRINDVEWKARTKKDGVQIPVNTIVEVTEVKGVKLYVEQA